jgi:hypothetical protein
MKRPVQEVHITASASKRDEGQAQCREVCLHCKKSLVFMEPWPIFTKKATALLDNHRGWKGQFMEVAAFASRTEKSASIVKKRPSFHGGHSVHWQGTNDEDVLDNRRGWKGQFREVTASASRTEKSASILKWGLVFMEVTTSTDKERMKKGPCSRRSQPLGVQKPVCKAYNLSC